jgi:tetratricopeptide (TPR) repeat protein
LFFYALANQYDRIDEIKIAEANFKKAYELRPAYKEGLVEYPNYLINVKEFDKCLGLIENIKADENLKFEYFLIKGRAYTGMERYKEAIKHLLEGNKIYNSNISLLNSLGFCFYRTGQKTKAIDILNASLRLNSAQENVKQLIAEIEKNNK